MNHIKDFGMFESANPHHAGHMADYRGFSLALPAVDTRDMGNFALIFNSLYESHLSLNERQAIESGIGPIDESWFSDLVDKGKRKVLKVQSKAGELLVDLATKAKDILDFAKQLAGQIGNYVRSQFEKLKGRIKDSAMRDQEFIQELMGFFKKKKADKLKFYVKYTTDLIRYILSGQLITDMVTRLSEAFSKVFNLGTNEGLSYLEDEFLFEADQGVEKKSFLKRLGEKVMSLPPFSWIPRIEELMKKGMTNLWKFIDRFLAWVTTGETEEGARSRFDKGLYFMFQILELYLFYKISGKIEKFKEYLDKVSGLEGLKQMTDQLKDKSLSEVWQACGFNPDEIANNIKGAIKMVPYVGDIISVLDSLLVSLGVYLAVEPTLKKLVA